MHIRQTYLHFYTTLIRIAYPSGRRRRRVQWTPHTHASLLLRWIAQWTSHHAILHAQLPPPPDIPQPSHLLKLTFTQTTREYLDRCQSAVKKSLHGTFRKHMRKCNNDQRTIIDDAYQSKQLGKVIQYLTAQAPSHCDLSTLHCPTEGQITDHYRIHRKVTEFFQDWYDVPATLDAAADSLTSTPGWWKTLLYSSTAVGDTHLHQSSAIPPHLQRGLRKA